MSAAAVKREIDALGDPERAAFLQGYLKTGPGEYAEGDVLIGVNVPEQRKVAKANLDLSLSEIDKLLRSKFHEHRSVGLMILTYQCERADLAGRKERYEFYLARTDRVNNWDLVDLSCREVVGGYLLAKGGSWAPLKKLARSGLLWDRRIAMVSTWTFTHAGNTEPTFELAELLLGDDHDLMHKAVGWMLREAGKVDPDRLDEFLLAHASEMPRTALRYAIERMPPEVREHWRSL